MALLRLSRNHFRVTTPNNCNCFLCENWKDAQKDLKVLRSVKTTDKQRIAAERTALVSELRINLWSELCWYAYEEDWQEGWMQKAATFLMRDERDWIMNLQYISMGEWLNEFTEYQR